MLLPIWTATRPVRPHQRSCKKAVTSLPVRELPPFLLHQHLLSARLEPGTGSWEAAGQSIRDFSGTGDTWPMPGTGKGNSKAAMGTDRR